GDAGAGGAGGLGIGQHRAQEGQRRCWHTGEPVGERGEDPLGCLRRRPADLRDGGGVDHSPVQLLLGPEVVHDQACVHSCGRGHCPDGGPVVPGAEEDLGRGVEDARFGAAALMSSGCYWSSSRYGTSWRCSSTSSWGSSSGISAGAEGCSRSSASWSAYSSSAYSSSGLPSVLDVMAASFACRGPGRNRQPEPAPDISRSAR